MSSRAPVSSPVARITRAAVTPLGVTVAAAVIAAWIAIVNGPFAGPGIIATITLLMMAVGFIVIAVHELAHLAASRIVGFRTISLTIGPLRLVRTRTGVRIRSAEDWQLGGGMLACLPRDGENVRRRWMWVVGAGPAASILVGVAGWLLAPPFGFDQRMIRTVAETSGPAATLFLVALLPSVSVVSLIAGVASLIPSRRGFLLTDGAQLRLLARGGPEAERWCAQIMLTAAARGGVRPRDWNPSWIDSVTAMRDAGAHEALGHLAAFYWALDRGDAERAAMHFARSHALIATLPPRVQSLVHLDTAYFEARVRGDATSARAALGKATAPNVPRFAHLRSKAAVLLVEGDLASAAEHARAGLAALAQLEREELVRFPAEEEWLHTLLADAEQAMRAESTPAVAPSR